MPSALITNWSQGPMGPGFFLLFPRTARVWYDGGPMDAGIDYDLDSSDEEQLGIWIALILLMRAQC